MEHIGIEQMMDVIMATHVDSEYMRKIAAINAHIMKCDECKQVYQNLLNADDTLETELALARGQENQVVESSKDNSASGLTERLRLSIISFAELIVESLDSLCEFYHPAIAGMAKSYSDNDCLARDDRIRSSVVDDDKNRISISRDRTLSVYYGKQYYHVGDTIEIASVHDQTMKFESVFEDYDSQTVVARFNDMEIGEYIVSFPE